MAALRNFHPDDAISVPIANTATSPELELEDLSHLPLDEFDIAMIKQIEARHAANPNWRNETISSEDVIKHFGLENQI